MTQAYEQIDGGGLDLLIVADHASAHVPADIRTRLVWPATC